MLQTLSDLPEQCVATSRDGQACARSMPEPAATPSIYNVNVGVLGHVDSGKTSLGALLHETKAAELR